MPFPDLGSLICTGPVTGGRWPSFLPLITYQQLECGLPVLIGERFFGLSLLVFTFPKHCSWNGKHHPLGHLYPGTEQWGLELEYVAGSPFFLFYWLSTHLGKNEYPHVNISQELGVERFNWPLINKLLFSSPLIFFRWLAHDPRIQGSFSSTTWKTCRCAKKGTRTLLPIQH